MSACVQDAPLPHRPAARPPVRSGWAGEPLRLAALLAPAAAVFAAFFLLPLVRLILIGAGGTAGWCAITPTSTSSRPNSWRA